MPNKNDPIKTFQVFLSFDCEAFIDTWALEKQGCALPWQGNTALAPTLTWETLLSDWLKLIHILPQTVCCVRRQTCCAAIHENSFDMLILTDLKRRTAPTGFITQGVAIRGIGGSYGQRAKQGHKLGKDTWTLSFSYVKSLIISVREKTVFFSRRSLSWSWLKFERSQAFSILIGHWMFFMWTRLSPCGSSLWFQLLSVWSLHVCQGAAASVHKQAY